MKIGFDLDGVLATQSTTEIVLMKHNIIADKVYYKTRQPNMFPTLFLHKNDLAVIITARRVDLKEITEEWCKRHFPQFKLYYVNCPTWIKAENIDEWFREVAKRKAELIKELELDVYFEDIPKVVLRLRKLCLKCKVIQYGGRI